MRRKRKKKEVPVNAPLYRPLGRTEYAETAYGCADQIWKDAWDAKDSLKKDEFKEILSLSEKLIKILGPLLPE